MKPGIHPEYREIVFLDVAMRLHQHHQKALCLMMELLCCMHELSG